MRGTVWGKSPPEGSFPTMTRGRAGQGRAFNTMMLNGVDSDALSFQRGVGPFIPPSFLSVIGMKVKTGCMEKCYHHDSLIFLIDCKPFWTMEHGDRYSQSQIVSPSDSVTIFRVRVLVLTSYRRMSTNKKGSSLLKLDLVLPHGLTFGKLRNQTRSCIS